MSIETWGGILSDTGFDGISFEVHDCEDESHYSISTMMATARVDIPSYHPHISIVYTILPPQAWLNELSSAVKSITGLAPQIEHLETAVVDDRLCIFLGEIDRPLLDTPTKNQFISVKNLVTRSQGILWVARGGTLECTRPHSSLHTGLIRALRTEDSSKRLVTLDLDSRKSSWEASAVGVIVKVVKHAFDLTQDPGLLDLEYAEYDGIVSIARAYGSSPSLEAASTISHANKSFELQPFYQTGYELRLGVGVPGLLDTLVFSAEPASTVDLPADFVEIEPRAFGLNFRDVMVAMGQLDADIMGFECSGVVTRIGTEAALHNLDVGDRVCALMRGHWSNVVRLHWTSVHRITDDMSFEVAATIPMAFTTAYYALYDQARLEQGDTVLIHSAAGGVGQAAIILAQRIGAEVFVSAGSDEKREFLQTHYDIPNDHIFSSRDTSFVSKLKSITQNKGVDVVLNSLAGELLQESFNCIAPFGRFVEIGKRDLELNHQLGLHPFVRNVTFASVDLIALGTSKGSIVARIMGDVIRLIKEKGMRYIMQMTVYPITDLEKAFRTMQAGKHIGKMVVLLDEQSHVKVRALGCD